MKLKLVMALMCLILTNSTLEVGDVERVTVTFEDTTTISEEPKTEADVEAIEIDKRTFRVTAYCACEKCCGEWAKNRPTDELGKPIVIGALGTPLTSESCASPLPFGTEISLEDYGVVVVEDRTADWVVNKHGENIIDLYMEDHNEALEFGVKYMEGVIM